MKENHDGKKEIWLVYYKRHSGKPSIPYDDSVEEAICYGWIDGTIKRIDDERYTRKFTPRRKKSNWSQLNIKRARKVIEAELMTPVGLKKIPEDVMEAIKSGRVRTEGVVPNVLPTPPEREDALALNPKAKENWERFAPSHRKQYILWVLDAKRQETRLRRIKKLITIAKENKRTMI